MQALQGQSVRQSYYCKNGKQNYWSEQYNDRIAKRFSYIIQKSTRHVAHLLPPTRHVAHLLPLIDRVPNFESPMDKSCWSRGYSTEWHCDVCDQNVSGDGWSRKRHEATNKHKLRMAGMARRQARHLVADATEADGDVASSTPAASAVATWRAPRLDSSAAPTEGMFAAVRESCGRARVPLDIRHIDNAKIVHAMPGMIEEPVMLRQHSGFFTMSLPTIAYVDLFISVIGDKTPLLVQRSTNNAKASNLSVMKTLMAKPVTERNGAWMNSVNLSSCETVHEKVQTLFSFQLPPSAICQDKKDATLSSAGSITEAHYDYHGATGGLQLLSGRKVFTFLRPSQRNLMLFQCFKRINIAGVSFFDLDVIEDSDLLIAELAPGDLVFFPGGTIHKVVTREDSFAVGTNFYQQNDKPAVDLLLQVNEALNEDESATFPGYESINWNSTCT